MLSGPVHLVEHSGSDSFASIRLGERTLVARFPGRVRIDAGHDLGVDFDIADLHVFDTATGVAIHST
jgi:ABC-type sugar transport system ATPase subunit